MCKLIDKNGSDFWWELPVEKLLGRKLISELNLDPSELEKGKVCIIF